MTEESYFSRKLREDPDLATRCEAAVKDIRKSVEPHVEAARRSEQLGPNDYRIVINTRADNY